MDSLVGVSARPDSPLRTVGVSSRYKRTAHGLIVATSRGFCSCYPVPASHLSQGQGNVKVSGLKTE